MSSRGRVAEFFFYYRPSAEQACFEPLSSPARSLSNGTITFTATIAITCCESTLSCSHRRRVDGLANQPSTLFARAYLRLLFLDMINVCVMKYKRLQLLLPRMGYLPCVAEAISHHFGEVAPEVQRTLWLEETRSGEPLRW